MLQPVETASLYIAAYEEHADPAMLAQIRAMAVPLRDLRVININATADGGGVEIGRAHV